MRILLADDHQLVRSGIRALLEGLPNVEVVGEASDGKEALEMAHACKPDILLMDIAMKNMNGLDASVQLSQELPSCRIIILSMHATGDYLQQALRAGARGYIVKDAATLELQLALDAVSRGDVYLSPSVSAQVVQGYLQQDNRLKPEQLTPRQTEILRMIAAGGTTKEIARKLEISVKTIETHRSQIMDRLDIRDLAGLVRYAVRTGLIDADQ